MKARISDFSKTTGFYDCQYPWPDDCFVQSGDRGIVITDKGSYRTAFFEAFPRSPNTFIRGEGETIQAAEAQAWGEYQRVSSCPGPNGHEFEARGYENGAGICKHCGMFSTNVIPPIHPCAICGSLTWYSKDNNGLWYCKEHYAQIPDDALTHSQRFLRDMMKDAPAREVEP